MSKRSGEKETRYQGPLIYPDIPAQTLAGRPWNCVCTWVVDSRQAEISQEPMFRVKFNNSYCPVTGHG